VNGDMSDPILRKIIVGEFVKFHIWVISALIVGLFGWVWNTSAQVSENTNQGTRHEQALRALPQIQTDVEVIKERQKNMEGKVAEVNHKLDILINRAIDSPTARTR